MRTFALVCFLLIGSLANITFAQNQEPCGYFHANQRLLQAHPELIKPYTEFMLNGMNKDHDDTSVFVIPVVFHVLHEYGVENISDDQVNDQLRILNESFNALNANLSQVIPEFDTLIGDGKIQFKLATKDPWGNCTNGIEHVFTHLANNAHDHSKINQWNRANYLNIWVIKNFTESGLQGYTYKPVVTNDGLFWIDGIVMVHSACGTIGTGIVDEGNTLVHECGHWIGLSHVWGDGEVETACGDDGVSDTPETKGFFSWCPSPAQSMVCNANIVENYQNIMDYSNCKRMFTEEQVHVMRNVLQASDGYRNNLITAANHELTGIDLTSPPECAPIADFHTTRQHTCVGSSISFQNASFNANVENYFWTFQDATPATSSMENPSVVFNSPGAKKVSLTVSNAVGENTKTIDSYIVVNDPWADVTGPYMFDLNSNHTDWFRIDNPERDGNFFHRIPSNGKDNSPCFKLNIFRDISDALPGTDDYFYYERLRDAKDALITPSFDLRNTSSVQFSFDYSYATNASSTELMNEVIKIFYSRNCGETWTQVSGGQSNWVQGADLISAGYAGGTDFKPANNSDWKTKTVSINTSSLDDKTRFKIEFTASNFSSNLYIDNINVSGIMQVGELGSLHQFELFPNPVKPGETLNIRYEGNDEDVTYSLVSTTGELVSQVNHRGATGPTNFEFSIPAYVQAGYYLLHVNSSSMNGTYKIVIH